MREDLGTAALKVRTGERGATMAVFSKSLVPALSELPEQLEGLVRQARSEDSDGQLLQGRLAGARAGRKRCERCGQVIPRRYGVCPACLEKGKLLFRLLGYARPHWRLIGFSLLLMVLATNLGLSQPLLLSVLIDDVLNSEAEATRDVKLPFDLLALLPVSTEDKVGALAWLVGLLIGINLTVGLLSAVRGYIMARIGQRVTYALRNEVYAHLHALSLSYYTKNETGRTMASVTQDVGRLQDFISDSLQEVIRDVYILIGICIILFGLNPGLAALVLLPTPLMVWATMRFGRKLRAIYRPPVAPLGGLERPPRRHHPGGARGQGLRPGTAGSGQVQGTQPGPAAGRAAGGVDAQPLRPGHDLRDLHRHDHHLVGRGPRHPGR